MNPNDGILKINHSTVVTRIDNDEDIYLTYYTTDKKDEHISTFIDLGVDGYAWGINH